MKWRVVNGPRGGSGGRGRYAFLGFQAEVPVFSDGRQAAGVTADASARSPAASGRTSTSRLRALFINENIGGHATMHQAIRKALAEHDDVDVEIRHVPRARGIRRLASARVPGLAKLDVDFQPLRSQLAQSWHVRRRLLADAEVFDVVHVYTHNAGLLSHRLLASMPSVVSLDGTTQQNAYTLPQRSPTRFTPLTVRASRLVEERVYDAATLVVAQSEWCAVSLRGDYGVEDHKLRLIPFGITVPPPVPRRRVPVPRIAFVGTSLTRKGGWRLVDVWRTHLRDRCELHLVTRDPVKTEPGLFVHNDFHAGDGRLDDLLATTTALVFPSIIDKWGYAVLEALAAGVPVIAFEGMNAIPELVTHEESGLLVPIDDEAIAAAVVRLLDSPDFATTLGAAGRADVLRRFDARKTTGQLVDTLHEAVHRYRREPAYLGRRHEVDA